nr:RHS repeat-associated core domain-containing protein [Microbulbifer sp.]
MIHMNGRLYDPTLGRFLSPDPFVQAPANSQSWNRYSYVFNSPLNFTDPSGFIGIRQKFHDSTGGGSSDGWDVYVVGSQLGSGFKETTWNDLVREYGSYYDNRREPGEEIAINSSMTDESESIEEVVCNANPDTGECSDSVYEGPSVMGFIKEEGANVILRSLQSLGGLGQVLLGGAICSGGATCAFGAVIVAKGADNIQSGIRGTDSYSEQLLTDATGSQTAGSLINAGLDVGTSIGGLARSVPKVGTLGSPSRDLFRRDPVNYEPAFRQTTDFLLTVEGLTAGGTIVDVGAGL